MTTDVLQKKLKQCCCYIEDNYEDNYEDNNEDFTKEEDDRMVRFENDVVVYKYTYKTLPLYKTLTKSVSKLRSILF